MTHEVKELGVLLIHLDEQSLVGLLSKLQTDHSWCRKFWQDPSTQWNARPEELKGGSMLERFKQKVKQVGLRVRDAQLLLCRENHSHADHRFPCTYALHPPGQLEQQPRAWSHQSKHCAPEDSRSKLD